MQRECTCAICGAKFVAGRKGALFCSKHCRYENHKRYSLEWYHAHKGLRDAQQRERRERERRKAKPDTIVAIGYAERQMADSLRKAGKVRTEL